jgi:outer membrane protein
MRVSERAVFGIGSHDAAVQAITASRRALGAIVRVSACAALLCAVASAGSLAETLPDALVRTYQVNPQLNAERARLRATDEGVSQALAGYRPQVTIDLSAGLQGVRNLLPVGDPQSATLKPWSTGVTVKQSLFNGLKTTNTVRQAEAQVRSGRETLRTTEQSVLLDAVTVYMSVLANQSLVEAQRAALTFLRETLDITRKRYDAGDVTPTDVAQAEARLSRGIADLNAAEVSLAVSQATYAQVVGSTPGRLAPAEPVDRLLPPRREDALALSRREHPSIAAATFDLDAAQHAVNIAESGLYPNVSVQGNVSRNSQTDTTLGTTRTDSASVIGQASVPVYDGGLAASQVRQSKETLAQTRTLLDRVRAQAETAVAAAWVTNEGSRIALTASESEVRAANVALAGVQKEAQAGQRTTLDVLNSQQDLTAARARLINAQKDRVIASYTLLSAIGRLDHARLGLNTPDYDAAVHYQQVRDAWRGIRTPSGQ